MRERERETSYICYMTFHNQTQDQKDSGKKLNIIHVPGIYIVQDRVQISLLLIIHFFESIPITLVKSEIIFLKNELHKYIYPK